MTILNGFDPSWSQTEKDAYFAREYKEMKARKAPEGISPELANSRAFREAQPKERIRVVEPARQPKPAVTLERGDSVKIEPIRWLWNGWLAKGKLHVIGGAPGAGKTTISLDLAATATRGGTWPDGSRCAKPGNVIIWSGEDDPRDTLAPRLIAMGADMARIYFVSGVTEGAKERQFDPSKDVEALARTAAEVGNVSLIIVDPVVSAVAGDSHKNAETRRGLQPLVDLAARLDAALIGITHFTKGTAGRAPLERVTGSLAFGALARVVIVAAKNEGDEEGPARIVARAKSNIGPDDGGFGYDLEQRPLPGRDDIEAQSVAWGEALEGSARDILAKAEGTGEREGGRGHAVADAMTFLQATLAQGPVAAKEIEAEAASVGISNATLRRAKKELAIVVTRFGFGERGGYRWSLPGDGSPSPIGAQVTPIDAHRAPMTSPNKTGASTIDAQAPHGERPCAIDAQATEQVSNLSTYGETPGKPGIPHRCSMSTYDDGLSTYDDDETGGEA